MPQTLRVALAQTNVTVGDLAGNATRVLEGLLGAKAWQADLVIVPELVVTGYPPEDLLLKPQFVEENLATLRRLTIATRGLAALIGFVDRDRRGHLYNAAAVFIDGRHVATYHKRYLPNYGVFDEKRYFRPGTRPGIVSVGGVRVGITICEDLWEEAPCRQLARAGCRLVVNLSASPYHAGKLKVREQLFAVRARRHRVAVAYCNLVGGQDELVFDGASLLFSPHGRVLARGFQFREDLILADLMLEAAHARRATWNPRPHPRLPAVNPAFPPLAGSAGGVIGGAKRPVLGPIEEVYEALVLGTRDYVRKNGFETVVLGLSGGIDSSLTACLAVDALGKERVVGVIMPSRFSSAQTQEDAKRLAQALGIRCETISIEPCFAAYLETVQPHVGATDSKEVMVQNLQARIRGNLLMALSNRFGWLVLTTGNKSEMATGYTTLYGDMAGGFAVIKDVPKTLVYQLATFRHQRGPGAPIPRRVFERPPTAELAPNQTDQDTLPPYEILDRVLKAYVEEDRSLKDILAGNRIDSGMARRVLRMVDRSEYKRRQGPPGIKITPRAFGKDRRMPITNRYQQS